MTRAGRRGRARRALGVVGSALGLLLVFVLALAGGLLLHLDTPSARRLAADVVSDLVSDAVAGDLFIERIGSLGLRRIEGVRASVRGPDGRRVLSVEGASATVDTWTLVRSLLSGEGPIRVPVESLTVDHVDADLDAGPQGESLRLAQAFQPAEEAPEAEEPPGRGLVLDAPSITVRHAWVHGKPPGAPAMDAELMGLRASGHVGPEVTRGEIKHMRFVTRGLPKGVDPGGTIQGSVALPSAEGAPLRASALFEGTVAGVPTVFDGRIEGEQVDARLAMTGATGDQVSGLLGEGIQLEHALTVRAEVHGRLPGLDAEVEVAMGRARVDLDGRVVLGPTTRVRAEMSARHVDLDAVLPKAPRSDLGLDARVRAAFGPEGIEGTFALDTLPGTLAGEEVPRIRARGRATGERASAAVRVLGAVAPTEVDVEVFPEGDQRIVEAQVRSRVPDLAALPAIPPGLLRGRAMVAARGRLELGTEQIAARFDLDGHDLGFRDLRVDDLRANGRVDGTLRRPRVAFGVHAADPRAGDLSAQVVDARADVALGDGVVVRDAHVDVVRAGMVVDATAARVAVEGSALRVEGGVLEGFGAPIGVAIERTGRTAAARVAAPAIDLGRVGRFLGAPDVLRGGHLELAGAVEVDGDVAQADLRVTARGVSALTVDGASLALDAALADGALAVAMNADLDSAGRLAVWTEDVRVGGSPLEPRAWREVTGAARLDADLNLAAAGDLLPPEQRPFGELAGWLEVQGRVARARPDGLPDARLFVGTRELLVAGGPGAMAPVGDVRVRGPAGWRSDDVDLQLDALLDAPTGQLAVAARAVDEVGIVAAVDAKARLPFERLAAGAAALAEELETAPISAKALVPTRTFDRMPSILRVRDVAGAVEAELDVRGTLREPRVRLEAEASGLWTESFPIALTSDVGVLATYDGERAELRTSVRAEGREVLALAAQAQVGAGDLLEAEGRLPWQASAHAVFDRFPLGYASMLLARPVRGRLTGEMRLEDLHRDARARARLALADLVVGGAEYRTGKIELDAGRGRAAALVRLAQEQGFLEARASAGIRWGAEVAPAPDLGAPIELGLVADRFRAAAFGPALEGTLNGFDGVLEGNASARIDPRTADARYSGRIAFREGRMQIAALGEELRDVRAMVDMSEPGVIAIRDVVAHDVVGRIQAEGRILTRGFGIESATASVRIRKKEAIDLALQGQPIGELWGRAELSARTAGDRFDVKVDVPELHVVLPEKLKGSVQELQERPEIRIGTYRGPDEFVVLPIERAGEEEEEEREGAARKPPPTRITMAVNLREVVVVRGNMARVVLTGDPRVVLGGETEVNGQIRVREGSVVLQGKEFEILKGTITFAGEEPSNPVVVATATWTAADGTQIFADFVGPVQTGKVELRSEPPRPDSEILSLILFGTEGGANPTPTQTATGPDTTTKAALALGGGLAAQGLTEALDDLTGIQAQARIDTTQVNNPRPEVEFQITPRISIEFSHVLGTPPISAPDKNLATFEWHFTGNWALETTFGDRGKAVLDAVWRKRY